MKIAVLILILAASSQAGIVTSVAVGAFKAVKHVAHDGYSVVKHGAKDGVGAVKATAKVLF